MRIAEYQGLPYAMFVYDPADELELRTQVAMLATRLRNHGRNVQILSLAEEMWAALKAAFGADLEAFFASEQASPDGLERAIQTAAEVLHNVVPLDAWLAERVAALDPGSSIVLLTRAEALFPMYRMSALLERLAYRQVLVPTVLFYPGIAEGINGLSFMGVFEPDHTGYRVRIY